MTRIIPLLLFMFFSTVNVAQIDNDLRSQLDSYFEAVKSEYIQKNEEQKLLSEWTTYIKIAIDTASTIELKRSIALSFYNNYLQLSINKNKYYLFASLDKLNSIYLDDYVFREVKQYIARSNIKYHSPYFHKLISVYRLEKYGSFIERRNGLFWTQNKNKFIEVRLDFIYNEYVDECAFSDESIDFLKDLIVLSNFEKSGFYSEIIVSFLNRMFDYFAYSSNGNNYALVFKSNILENVLNVNTNIDVIEKTTYIAKYSMPQNSHYSRPWYAMADSYYSSLIAENLGTPISNEFSKAKISDELEQYQSADPFELTWPKLLEDYLEKDLIPWYGYMVEK